MQYAALGDTVYFNFATNDTAGEGSDPTALDSGFFVRKNGATSTAAPVYSGDITLLTHAVFPPGCAEVAVPATAGNGFEAGETYAVFCSITVGSANPTGYLGSFTLNPVLTSGLGSGARSVTITVNNGSTVLEGARVRFIKGAENYVGTTNVSGVIAFSLDDGTWSVSISLAGHTFTPTTLVVNGTETVTYSMTVAGDVPDIDGTVTGEYVCIDETGEPAPNQTVSIKLRDAHAGFGLAGSKTLQSQVSDDDGVVRFTGLIKGATYTIRTSRDVRMVDIPDDAESPYLLPTIAR